MAGGLTGGPARLRALLAATPAHALTPTGVIWADLASAWTLAGLAPLRPGTTRVDPSHQQVLQSLAVPVNTFEWALVPDYATTFGFSPFQIAQGLQIGDPPGIITLLRGTWQQTDLVQAWTASKYREVKTPAGTVWSWADGPKLDFNDPVSRYGLGTRNNSALLPDGTVVFGETIAAVTQVGQTAAGAGAALAGDARIAGLVASAPTPLVSAMVLPGASLQQQVDATALIGATSPSAVATAIAGQAQAQRAAGAMPRPSFGLLGATGGTKPHIVVRLAVQTAKEAAQAAKVITDRAKHATSPVTKRPYAAFLTLVSAEGQADPPIAKAEFAPTEPAYAFLWLKLVYTRDLGLFGW